MHEVCVAEWPFYYMKHAFPDLTNRHLPPQNISWLISYDMKTFDLHVIYQFHSNTLGFSPGEVVELPSALLQCQDHSAAANSILKVAPGAYEKLEQTWDDWKSNTKNSRQRLNVISIYDNLWSYPKY